MGGRTGLTAVVIALLFACSIFLAPLFGDVPDVATAPCLVLVGVFMMKQVKDIAWADKHNALDMRTALPAFLTIIMMPFTYSIANGIFFGLGAFIILSLCDKDLATRLNSAAVAFWCFQSALSRQRTVHWQTESDAAVTLRHIWPFQVAFSAFRMLCVLI